MGTRSSRLRRDGILFKKNNHQLFLCWEITASGTFNEGKTIPENLKSERGNSLRSLFKNFKFGGGRGAGGKKPLREGEGIFFFFIFFPPPNFRAARLDQQHFH